MRGLIFTLLGILVAPSVLADSVAPVEGFADVNHVRLQYLDWGGAGPALIFIHDNGQNAHKFDDLASAFTDRFRVIAYSRRGSAGSSASSPYDIDTLTEDLRGLMDALAIAKADIVGHSFAGSEITRMAAEHPERVARLVYLDAAYDYSDPDFRAARAALPPWVFARPSSALASFDAYRSYEQLNWYSELHDMQRIEAYLRQNVVLQRDGSLKDRTMQDVSSALSTSLLSSGSDYTRVHCPALAIYAQYVLAIHSSDRQRRSEALDWEERYWRPFQAKSIERIRRDLPNVQVRRVPGRQVSFFLTERAQVVQLMRRFLSEQK